MYKDSMMTINFQGTSLQKIMLVYFYFIVGQHVEIMANPLQNALAHKTSCNGFSPTFKLVSFYLNNCCC